MAVHSKAAVALYVDKASHQWVVRDPDGKLWVVTGGDDPWANRRPFDPTDETDLESVPGHYKYMLGLSP
ncbi:MAG TPA: hypothetical protein VGF55_09445 [Gemmataceae bacterium]